MDNLGTPHLRLERQGSIAWCTIDRPAARNALTPAMYRGITRAVRLVNDDPDLAALVLTGTGDVFAPGGELGGRKDEGEEPVVEAGMEILPFLPVRDSPAPVISAINGICQGGGLLIAMLSDVSVASERATFRVPELLRGIPDAFYAAHLPAHVGLAVARDLMLTGRRLGAEEAARLGLVARVVAHDELHGAALDAARQVLQSAPAARLHVKRMLRAYYQPVDTMTMTWALGQPEALEGMGAFMEKRPPAWVPPDVASGRL